MFLEGWRRRHTINLERDSALPWLLGVALNVARNQRRTVYTLARPHTRDPREDAAVGQVFTLVDPQVGQNVQVPFAKAG